MATDAGGYLVLPGIVDLHGDAFERQLMPRPGVHFAPVPALLETDRQLLANGITTAYHGVTLSWEPGLRGIEAAREFLAALSAVRPRLGADARLHLRFECFNLDAVEEVVSWIEAGRIDLLAFNEHTNEDGAVVFRHACKMGLEGIVSKRKASFYRSGRSPDWLKSKNPACEAVKREEEEDWGR